jgi:hypothetical protein
VPFPPSPIKHVCGAQAFFDSVLCVFHVMAQIGLLFFALTCAYIVKKRLQPFLMWWSVFRQCDTHSLRTWIVLAGGSADTSRRNARTGTQTSLYCPPRPKCRHLLRNCSVRMAWPQVPYWFYGLVRGRYSGGRGGGGGDHYRSSKRCCRHDKRAGSPGGTLRVFDIALDACKIVRLH